MYFEDVIEGQELPQLERLITLTSMVMYAAATWDFHRYHYDEGFAKTNGFAAPFVDGQMVGALMAKQIMDWAGPDAFLRRLSYRLRSMVYPGDRFISRARVTGKRIEDGRTLAVCALDAHKADGTAVVSRATAAVELPNRQVRGS